MASASVERDWEEQKWQSQRLLRCASATARVDQISLSGLLCRVVTRPETGSARAVSSSWCVISNPDKSHTHTHHNRFSRLINPRPNVTRSNLEFYPPPTQIVMRSKFKDEHPFGERAWLPRFQPQIPNLTDHCSPPSPEKRKAEAERIRQKYPDRIPVRYLPYRPSKETYPFGR